MISVNNLCMRCMNDLKDEDICEKCGEKKGAPQEFPFLPKKTIIGSRYIVGCGLEINGEGLSYIGYDMVKNTKVYIREFLPANLCTRDPNLKSVSVPSYRKGIYEKELNKFLKYFRSVARLRNVPAIAAVYDIFNENETAYVIIEWIDGIKLDKFVGESGGTITWDKARTMFIPFISALNEIHTAGVLHLGIAPDNIFVTKGDKLKLSGFAINDLRNLNSPIEAELYDGCSALEQYIEIYDTDQSTDVYGLTASLFLALTGEYPQLATKRKKDDRLFMAREIVRSIPENVISGLASGLRVYPNNRTLSFERLKVELSDSQIAQITRSKEARVPKISKKEKNSNFIWGMISCGIALAALIACFVVYWFVFRKNETNQTPMGESPGNSALADEETTTIKNKIIVPDLSGKNWSELEGQDSSAVGYEVLLLSQEFDDNVPEGKVSSQTPSAGQEMDEGSIIAVNVSKGSKSRQLPSIAGKSISEVSLALSSIGIKPVESWKYDNSVAEGYVIGYADQQEGNSVDYGTQVVIIRSLGAGK